MLTPKRMEPKKKMAYAAVLAILCVATGVVLYRNFFSSPESPVPSEPAVQNLTGGKAASDTAASGDDELDFLQDARFLRLKRVGEPIDIDSNRTTNPFAPDNSSANVP